MTFTGRLNKQNLVHPNNGILFDGKKSSELPNYERDGGNLNVCFLMKKVMCKDYTLSDFNHKTFWKRPNNGDSKNSGYHGCSGGGLVSKRRELEQNLFYVTL